MSTVRAVARASLLFTCLAGFATTSSATMIRPAPPPTARRDWDAFTQRQAGIWSPRFGADGVPISVRATLTNPLFGWNESRARALSGFFDQNAAVFQLRRGVDAFAVQGERTQRGIVHMRMRQTYRGIPVRGGEYMVSLASDGRIRMLAGRSIPAVEAPTTARVSVAHAQAAALAAVARDRNGFDVTSSLAIDPDVDDVDHLVHVVSIRARDHREDWEVLVDAVNARVVATNDLRFGSTGCATIYRTNPLASSEDEDFDLTTPTGMNPAVLKNSMVEAYSGPNAEVSTSTILSPQGCYDFHYNPSSQTDSFDQANLFWLMDHYVREYLDGLGYEPETPAIVGTLDAYNGLPMGYAVGSGFHVTGYAGPSGPDNARDADIVYHELQHVIMLRYGIGALGATHDDAREIYTGAFHEGMATYFACAANNDPEWGESIYGSEGAFSCNSDPEEVNYENRVGPCSSAPSYCVGQIWSGALWDIRTEIGSITDQIALESLAYLPSDLTLYCAVDAMLQADADHHSGTYEGDMLEKFEARGLSAGHPVVTIEGPAYVAHADSGTFTANVCCGRAPYTYLWKARWFVLLLDVPDWVEGEYGTGTSAVIPEGPFVVELRVIDANNDTVTVTRSIGPTPAVIEGPSSINANTSTAFNVPEEYDENWLYEWYKLCPDPGCSGEGSWTYLGDGPSVYVSSTRNFSLVMRVTDGGAWNGEATKAVSVNGVPVAGISGPNQLQADEPGEYTASATGGTTPYTYRWSKNCLGNECVVGTGSTVTVYGGTAFDLYLSVTSNAGLQSNVVMKHVGAGVFAAPALPVALSLRALTNPVVDGSLQLVCGLPGWSPAGVEVFDVSGRRVAARDLRGLGTGLHTVAVLPDNGTLVKGIYLVRLTQGGRSLTQKVAVMR